MTDLLSEYIELIHEPLTVFEEEQITFPGDVDVYTYEDPMSLGRIVEARKKVTFYSPREDGSIQENIQEFAVNITISREMTELLYREVADPRDMLIDIYHSRLEKNLEIYIEEKTEELIKEAWFPSSDHASILAEIRRATMNSIGRQL